MLSLNTLFSFILHQFKQLGILFENGIVKAKEFVAEKITAKELCLEDVCVNKEQLKTLLEKNQLSPSESLNEPTPTPESTPEPTPETTSSPTPTPSTEPEPTPESTPSPSESPTP